MFDLLCVVNIISLHFVCTVKNIFCFTYWFLNAIHWFRALLSVWAHWDLHWSPGLKMRAIARSIHQFRSALRRQTCNYSTGLVRRRKLLTNSCSGLAYELPNNASFDRFRHPLFFGSRPLSIDAVQVTNGGTLLFLLVLCFWSIWFIRACFSQFYWFWV